MADDARIDMETASVLLLSVYARRQLERPKNRAKGVPRESVEQLVRLAQAELDEVLHAIRARRGTAAILAELGDAAAFVALAMWRAAR